MKCPVCKDVTLLMSEKNGVEIDYCPECRGIWLDRGELDKIIDRARDARDGYRESERQEYRREERRDDRHEGRYDARYDERARYDKKSKKKQSPLSALGDIMEIFGGE
ncbi:zf-TFIIB domain-containing protein [Enorma massiliensis]|uniref:TFIIB-type zinc ribbon-containing protein n=1 Tax=Enorma massiliensis TaxID=1472761 RepID=UPI001956B5CA|nr:zf-TFIIB domain-containing protein [Enorma massiliensis]MBM6784386.1 zf-TFIIB domain-containing protein [Enorma massiliensis]